LDLTRLGLTTLFPEVGQLSQLQWLDLRHNQLTSVPGELGQLSLLQELYLSYNQLTSVPGELGQLSQLHYFDLAANPNLHHPPLDVVHKGVEAILTFLRTGGRIPPDADLAEQEEPT